MNLIHSDNCDIIRNCFRDSTSLSKFSPLITFNSPYHHVVQPHREDVVEHPGEDQLSVHGPDPPEGHHHELKQPGQRGQREVTQQTQTQRGYRNLEPEATLQKNVVSCVAAGCL